MHKASAEVMAVDWVASYFAASYRIAVAEALIEDTKYTANRKKAEEYVAQLKEVWDKLTTKQKKREITSAAETLNIGSVNMKIPDTITGIEKLSVKLSDGRTEKLLTAIGSYPSFRKSVNFGNEAANAGAFLASVAITGIANKINDELKIREKARQSSKRLINKIFKFQKDEPKVKEFTARARELNKTLEGGMERYSRFFNEALILLYPKDDPGKSKEERQNRKNSGGTYFTDEESDAVLMLGTFGKFLMQIVDTKFEGDDDGE
jgi:hypothetical protein